MKDSSRTSVNKRILVGVRYGLVRYDPTVLTIPLAHIGDRQRIYIVSVYSTLGYILSMRTYMRIYRSTCYDWQTIR
jgi:hypothetical protein